MPQASLTRIIEANLASPAYALGAGGDLWFSSGGANVDYYRGFKKHDCGKPNSNCGLIFLLTFVPQIDKLIMAMQDGLLKRARIVQPAIGSPSIKLKFLTQVQEVKCEKR